MEDLKNLFRLKNNTLCETHDLLGCKCCITLLFEDEEDVAFQEAKAKAGNKGFFLRKKKKSDLSGEELEGWDHLLDVSVVEVSHIPWPNK